MVNLFPGVPPSCLCDKHLNSVLSEYYNLLIPSIRKGHSIEGYIRHGCVDLPHTHNRIVACAEEAKNRGKDWGYPYKDDVKTHMGLMEKYRKKFPDIDDVERRVN